MGWRAQSADEAWVGSSFAVGVIDVAASNLAASNLADLNVAAWTIFAVLLWAGWYLIACALFPWRACEWCEGGKKRSSSRKHWRDCRHCDGTGRRARIGRRVWSALGRGHHK